jgi:hypothetical protein
MKYWREFCQLDLSANSMGNKLGSVMLDRADERQFDRIHRHGAAAACLAALSIVAVARRRGFSRVPAGRI